MKTVLVTGGAGYIGSHACKALALQGYLPITYDNLIYGHEWAVKWGPFEKGDINDRSRLDEVFNKYKPDAVMHFAAYAYVGESVVHPAKYYRNNVAGSLTLLEAMKDHLVDKFIFSSSCATYGTPIKLPIPEDHEQKPINPYGRTKLTVEQIMADFAQAYGLHHISLRYFNAAGADPDAEIGEDHNPETHLIPLVLKVAAGEMPHIVIYGDDYDTQDGTCIRDFIHVSDLAQAHILALMKLEKGCINTAYNLGNGLGFSVKDVIETARKVTQKEITVKVGMRRPGDPPCLVGAAQKAVAELQWSPRYPSLSSIIETAWKWVLH